MHGNLEILLLLAMCFPIVLLTRRLGGSTLIAYIIVGAIAGNVGFVAHGNANIHMLAEIGASLLLFSLGLEIDLPNMRKHIKRVLVGAIGQIGLTVAAGTGMMMALGQSAETSFIIGCCLALSSTLMVLRALDEQRLRNKEEGHTIIGLLLAQDFAIAPMMLIISIILPSNSGHSSNTLQMALGIIGLILMTIFLRHFLASHLINRIRGAQVPELEVAMSITIALGAAYFTENIGLGTAIGAFCAGLALGGDEHRHTIESSTRPLQGLMAIIFFVSIGLQFDLNFVFANPYLVTGALIISVVFKSIIAIAALRVTGMPLRSAIGAGIMIGQVGEFSFVLVNAAFGTVDHQDSIIYGLIVSVACLSLALTPFLVQIAARLFPKSSLDYITIQGETIVVAGLGPVGNTIVKALHENGHPLFLIDRNEKLLAPWQGNDGITCHMGKIEEMEEWLPVLGSKPRILVLTFPIADASALVAERVLKMDPDLIIIARSPYEIQIDTLYNAGIRYVICDERESAKALEPLLHEILGHNSENRSTTSSYRKMNTSDFRRVAPDIFEVSQERNKSDD